MYCQFLSHKFCNNIVLAGITKQYIAKIQPKETVCISTCLRIEFYSKRPFTLLKPPNELAADWYRLEGVKPVLIRLARIASGVDSKILGERFITFQCMRPFLKTIISNMPFDLIDKSFEIAQRVKAKYNFESDFSYDDAAHKILNFDSDTRMKTLVIIGGGLLGQHIACNHGSLQYSNIILITKRVNDCLNDLKSLGHSQSILVTNISDVILPESFDCVIATNSPNASYTKRLLALINKNSKGQIIDLCASPIINDNNNSNLRFITMYDPAFISLVDSANEKLIHIVPKVEKDIQTLIDEIRI